MIIKEILENDMAGNAVIAAQYQKYQKEEFQTHLTTELGGLTIAVMIQFAMEYPKPLTNKQVRKILKKSRMAITTHFRKLQSLGYVQEVTDIYDTRTKPFILTEKGLLFLFHLYKDISNHLCRNREFLEEKISFLG
ncbi:MAG: hypothetical protein ACFFD4_13165 [Candidatus Odinarchaeota archaeon]